MAKRKLHISLLLTFILGIYSQLGNAQTISFDFDDKVIWADSLNMPESTIAQYIIGVLPELLERPGVYFLNDYTVKIEDIPVGNSVDAVLTQIRLCDIEKITVSESPLSSYQNNSKSGSINIVLKKRNTKEKNYWGSASADITTPLDYNTKTSFGYKKDKLMLRALLLNETYEATYDTHDVQYDGSGSKLWETNTSDRNKFWSNMTNVFMNYQPTPKDELVLNVSLLKIDEKDESVITGQDALRSDLSGDLTEIRSLFKYNHKFSAANEFNAEFQYDHHPTSAEFVEQASSLNMKEKDDDLSGQVKVKLSLLPSESKHKSFLSIGTNGNISFDNGFADHTEAFGDRHAADDKVRSRGLTPFVESENTFGPFRLKAQANLQYYHYDFQRIGCERMEKDNTDLAGKLMTEWHFRKGHVLRLIADHQIKRPSEAYIYPYTIEDVSTMQHQIGNIDLKNVYSNNFTIDYIHSNRWSESSLTMNASASYNHISNIIARETITPDEGDPYTTYANVGTNNMFVALFMAMYKYKRFSLTLTADHFNNRTQYESDKDHYRYFNIVLMPTYKTLTNWMGSMRITYCSPVRARYIHKGGCCAVSFQVGKSWGNINVHAYGNVPLTGRTTDIAYGASGERSESTYDVMKNALGIGVRYGF